MLVQRCHTKNLKLLQVTCIQQQPMGSYDTGNVATGLCKACAQFVLCAAGFEGLKSWFKDSLLGIADDLAKDQYKHLYKVPEWVRPWTAAVAKVGPSVQEGSAASSHTAHSCSCEAERAHATQ
jgi:hypothetical protein